MSLLPGDDPHAFWLAARWQRACVLCGATGAFEAHHGVPKRFLKRAHLPLYDVRGAVRLCPTCHSGFEARMVRLPLARLPTEVVEYAFEALGSAAEVLLRRWYDGDDPRVEAMACGV